MTTITQTLTVLPTAPARSQVPLTFIANADAFIGALALFQTQQNTLTGQINTVSGEVATNAATTATNTTTVNTAAAAVAAQSPVTNAAAAAFSATAAANSATAAATSAGGVNFTLTSVSTLTSKTLTAPVINGFSGTGNGAMTGNLAVTGALSATGAVTAGSFTTVNSAYPLTLRANGPAANNNYQVQIDAIGVGPQPADSGYSFKRYFWNGTTYVQQEVFSTTSTGLAVTGALSATGNIKAGANAILETPSWDGNFLALRHSSLAQTAATSALCQSAVGTTFLNSPSGQPLYLAVNITPVATITSTGLAVTGTLSATGALTTAGLKEDASGNLGLGVTPSAWGSGFKALQFGSNGVIYSAGAYNYFGSNSYYDGANLKYLTTAAAGLFGSEGGAYKWYTAPSGTAGNPITFTQAMTLDASGNLLVGATSSGAPTTGVTLGASSGYGVRQTAHPTGTASASAYDFFLFNGVPIGSITQSGTTAVLYNTTSDARLKTNVVNAPDAASLIDSIQVRSFDWKSDGSHQRYGMVAQELYEVAPEAVSKPQDPDEMMAVDYSKLVPMLVLEIQSLRQRLATAGI